MSLYPSFQPDESEVVKQHANTQISKTVPATQSLYPSIEYLGLDLSQFNESNSNQAIQTVLPVPSVKGKVTNDVRQITLCKDANGKVGLLVSEVNKGIFVSFVSKDSPAAMGGLRFGDQILQLNGTNLAGFSADKVHKMFKKCPVNDIHLIVRDRPLERTITLIKDETGHLGFRFKNGKITDISKDSSAARNGLVIDHNILEVQGRNVIGMEDKEITRIIQDAGTVITITIIPSIIYDQMMKKIRADYVKASMDHSVLQ